MPPFSAGSAKAVLREMRYRKRVQSKMEIRGRQAEVWQQEQSRKRRKRRQDKKCAQ